MKNNENNRKKEIVGFLSGVIFMCVVLGTVFFGCSNEKITEAPEDAEDISHSGESIRKELGIGDAGGDVVELQERLLAIDVFGIVEFDEDEEGYYGEQTQYYVTLFQSSQDIEPTGVVDQRTWNALDAPIMPSEEVISKLKEGILIDDGFDQDDIYYSPTFQKIAYLTFDDGPHPVYTQQIIDLLEKYNAGATFFALGQNVDAYPKITKNAAQNEKNVANHTYTHIDITKATEDEIREEILLTNEAIVRVTDKNPLCFRPPYGAILPTVREKIQKTGFNVIMWDVDPQDWRSPGPDRIADHIIKYTQHGEVILLHDGGGDRTQTVIALEKLLKKMTEEGWKFLPLQCV